jgi:hypothetical protein
MRAWTPARNPFSAPGPFAYLWAYWGIERLTSCLSSIGPGKAVPTSVNTRGGLMDLVAGYFRVSQARDGRQSPDIYRDEIDRYCASKQLALAEVFADIDYSGWRGSKTRPALQEL